MDFSQLAAVAAAHVQKVQASGRTPAYSESDVVATIKNRFGTFDFTDDQVLTLKPGMVGFTEYSQFALAPLPTTGMGHDFRLFQCLEEPGLCFIVYPTTAANSLLDAQSVSSLCEEHNIRREDLILLHVATIRENGTGRPGMTLNIKAPVVINAFRQTGTQQVLASNKYTTQYALLPEKDVA
jgi:flagellar assembly factor FliW